VELEQRCVRQQLGAGRKSLLSAHDARDVQRRASPSEAKDPSGQPANAHARPCRRRSRVRTARRRPPPLHHRSRSPRRKARAPLRKGVRVRGAALEDAAMGAVIAREFGARLDDVPADKKRRAAPSAASRRRRTQPSRDASVRSPSRRSLGVAMGARVTSATHSVGSRPCAIGPP
jgi:hypothetical protein